MKILAIIPARGGSKGVPRKNIKLLAGKPLLEYTSAVTLKSSLLSKVVISTDDDEIISVAKKLGLEIPFKRPKDLATDSSSSLSVILHALEHFESKNIYFDAVCLLQVTSPFRTVEFLDKAIQEFIKSDADSLISVQEVPHEYNPHWSFELDENKNLKIATGETEIINPLSGGERVAITDETGDTFGVYTGRDGFLGDNNEYEEREVRPIVRRVGYQTPYMINLQKYHRIVLSEQKSRISMRMMCSDKDFTFEQIEELNEKGLLLK